MTQPIAQIQVATATAAQQPVPLSQAQSMIAADVPLTTLGDLVLGLAGGFTHLNASTILDCIFGRNTGNGLIVTDTTPRRRFREASSRTTERWAAAELQHSTSLTANSFTIGTRDPTGTYVDVSFLARLDNIAVGI